MAVIEKPESISRQVWRHLRGRILAGGLGPGATLVGADLARELEVSRTPVREALMLLEREGLVSAGASGIAVVRDLRADLADLLGVREALETYAARRAAGRITPAQVARLERLCDEAEALPLSEFESRARLNRAFHDLMVAAAGNGRLALMVREYADYFAPAARLYDAETARRSLADHREMVAALRARDGEALACLIRAHLARALDAIRTERPQGTSA